MPFHSMRAFISALEKKGELHRVSVPVSPMLEITEIASRAITEDKPALLFENVEGSPFPVAINLLGSKRRVEIALGEPAEAIGERMLGIAENLLPPTAGMVWRNRRELFRLSNARPKYVRRAPFTQNRIMPPDLTYLPVLKCWPGDGGKFVTLPLVITHSPKNGKPNMGIYRMQVFDKDTTGMHMQIQKGGSFHQVQAERMNKGLPCAVAIGADPALTLSAISALPEDVNEIAFAGYLRGSRSRIHRLGESLIAPSEAEFILEGVIPTNSTHLEGPFGDHFGHYSEAALFPIFKIHRIWHRQNPIYAATVVGKPPMEDRFMGDATQMIAGPLIRLLKKEIRDIWAYYEAGFHNLLVAAIDQRYTREAIKTALGIMGEGQLSLTKVLILVDSDVKPRDFNEVMHAVCRNFRSERDFRLIARTSQDTLDFTGEAMHLGSKMIIDATRSEDQSSTDAAEVEGQSLFRSDLPESVEDFRVIGGRLLFVKTSSGGRRLVQDIVTDPNLRHLKIAAVLSSDVDIHNDIQLLWGLFTRFDCARDVIFTNACFKGISPEYSGVMGIDATWKKGYPKPLEMDPTIVKKVDLNWSRYWK